MRKRPELTYAGALKLLGKHDSTWLERLNTALGWSIIAGGPVTGGVLWGLVDPKNEAVSLLRSAVDAARDRLRGSTGQSRHELIQAAHTILVLSAFFDACHEVLGERFNVLTEDDKQRLASLEPNATQDITDQLRAVEIPVPSATCGFEENLKNNLVRRFDILTRATFAFCEGLSPFQDIAADERRVARLRDEVQQRAATLYRDRYLNLAVDVPEFAFWADITEHAATRAELRTRLGNMAALLEQQSHGLSTLQELLGRATSGTTSTVRPYPERLATAARAVLRKPLLRSEMANEQRSVVNLRFPTVEEGFITPRFRMAVQDEEAKPAHESWWKDETEVRDDLEVFLAGYLSDPAATETPLLILGHPGAGKSLLTEVLAARLPTESYTVVRVQLRRVNADASPALQIADELQHTLHERIEWGQVSEQAGDTIRVVIFDGFDELIQAAGVTKTSYLEQVREFQQQAADNGRPVVAIVTSRTVVVDRADIPHGAVILKLEEFSDAQVERWIDAWNRANIDTPGFRPLCAEELLRHEELARQPLLLLMLALYAADPNAERLDSEDLPRALLYQRLLDSFIRRQVRDKSPIRFDDRDSQWQEQERRIHLSIAAFGMFNRGQQYLSVDDLNRDLDALLPPPTQYEQRNDLSRALTRADRTVGDFFFIHTAEADGHRRDGRRRTYEFLHATFGEYLIAEYALQLLDDVTRRQEPAGFYGPVSPPQVEIFRKVLSHQVLATRDSILIFARELFGVWDEGRRNRILRVIAELLGSACREHESVQDGGYRPTEFDLVRRIATYTANLVLLYVAVSREPVPLENLASPVKEALPWWRSLVYLWRAGLISEAWKSAISCIELDERQRLKISDSFFVSKQGLWLEDHGSEFMGGEQVYVPSEAWEECAAAKLVGDNRLTSWISAGSYSWGGGFGDTERQRNIHNNVLSLASRFAPVASSLPSYRIEWYGRMLRFLQWARGDAQEITIDLLINYLERDAARLPYILVRSLVQELLRIKSVFYGRKDKVVYTSWERELIFERALIGVILAHPRLLLDVPGVVKILRDPEYYSTSLVISLWRAERTLEEPYRRILHDIRVGMDRIISGDADRGRPVHLKGVDLFKYLRVERPAYWKIDKESLEIFTHMIKGAKFPAMDVLFLARMYLDNPDNSDDIESAFYFLQTYMTERGEPTEGLSLEDMVERVEQIAAEEAQMSDEELALRTLGLE